MVAQTTSKDTLESSQIHDILRNDRRRLAIKCLRENEGTLSVRDLSEDVASRETGERPAPRDKRRSVYVSLHQTHLPKLDDLEIVFSGAGASAIATARCTSPRARRAASCSTSSKRRRATFVPVSS